MVNGELKFSAARLDHFLVCSRIIEGGLLTAVGIDSQQQFLVSDHFVCYASLDLSKLGFLKIEREEVEKKFEFDWRKLNQLVTRKIDLQNKGQAVPETISKGINSFVKKINRNILIR